MLFTSREKEPEMEHFALWDDAINSAVDPIRGFAQNVADGALSAANAMTKEVEKTASAATKVVEETAEAGFEAATEALDAAISALEDLIKDATDELSKAAQEATSAITSVVDDVAGDVTDAVDKIANLGDIVNDIGGTFTDITNFGTNQLSKLPNLAIDAGEDIVVGIKASAGLGLHIGVLMIKLKNLIFGIRAVYEYINPEGKKVVQEIVAEIQNSLIDLKQHVDMCSKLGNPEIGFNVKRKLVGPCSTKTPGKIARTMESVERIKEVYEIFMKEPQLFAQGEDVDYCKNNKPPVNKLDPAYFGYFQKCNQGLNISVLKSDVNNELDDLIGLTTSVLQKITDINADIIDPVMGIINKFPKINL